MKKMLEDRSGPGVRLDLAEMTRQLRVDGIRATADYALGTIVVSWGELPPVSWDEARRFLTRSGSGQPVTEAGVLVAWAACPASEVDAPAPALQDAIDVLAPPARTSSTARAGRQRNPPSSRPRRRAC
jgi:hypothetical protein